WLLVIILLPFEAYQAADAIVTTLIRMIVTHRHLLRWTTAAQLVHSIGIEVDHQVIWSRMIVAPILSALIGLLVAFTHPGNLPIPSPLILIWLVAPQIAYWISRPLPGEHQPAPLTEKQVRRLRALARRTWMFFEQFVGPEDHWLPPDHFQES